MHCLAVREGQAERSCIVSRACSISQEAVSLAMLFDLRQALYHCALFEKPSFLLSAICRPSTGHEGACGGLPAWLFMDTICDRAMKICTLYQRSLLGTVGIMLRQSSSGHQTSFAVWIRVPRAAKSAWRALVLRQMRPMVRLGTGSVKGMRVSWLTRASFCTHMRGRSVVP